MLKWILCLLITCCNFNLIAQPVLHSARSVIYLVRHAEKETGVDPILTIAGQKRAGDLLHTLKNKHIKRIYVTQFRRTQMTADSLRLQMPIDTVHYIADTTGEDLLHVIRNHHDEGRIILVIGHSNTIPKIIQQLGVANYPKTNIADGEFDDLFVVKYKKGKAFVKRMKYGQPSSVSSPMYH